MIFCFISHWMTDRENLLAFILVVKQKKLLEGDVWKLIATEKDSTFGKMSKSNYNIRNIESFIIFDV